MGKRKLREAERAAKAKRRHEHETIFSHGKIKRVKRPPTIDGISVDDFIRANADPIFLHQEEMWEYLDMENDRDLPMTDTPRMTSDGREQVSFITTEDGDDLIIAYAIALERPGAIASLILQRTPKYEFILPQDERGVVVSHELYPDEDLQLLRRIVVDGTLVDIETTGPTYLLDVSKVDPEDAIAARETLKRMHAHGLFGLDLT